MSVIGIAIAKPQTVQAFTINFDYTYDSNNFFDTTTSTERRDTLEAAADYFEPFTDNLSAITDDPANLSDIGPTGFKDSEGKEIVNTWDAIFTHPGDGTSESITDFEVAEDTLTIFVGGRDLSGADELGLATSGINVTGLSDFVDTIQTRGQSGALDNPATDFSTWGGSIAFDNTVTWNDSHLDAPGSGENDLLSVAIHELGHTLGFGGAASWDAQISGGNFTGTDSVALNGSNVPLETDGGHWQDGTTSTIGGVGSQETALDPSILTGTRKLVTDLDYAGLSDIGWQTEEVPFEFSPGLGLILVSGIFVLKKAKDSWKTKNQKSHQSPFTND